jgi:hypothetical protein
MRAAAVVIALFVLAVTGVAADESAPPPVATQQTTIHGAPPASLVGRWLVLSWLTLPKDKIRTNAAFWQVEGEGADRKLSVRFVGLPAAQRAAINGANEEGLAWHPQEADLAAIARGWDGLVPEEPYVTRVSTDISTRDAFDEVLKSDESTSDAQWVVRQTREFDHRAAPKIQEALVYSVQAAKDGGWTGRHVSVTVAAALIAIPITFKGTFQLYPMDPAARRQGLMAHLLDLFSGCGRR